MPAGDRLFELLHGCSDDELFIVWASDLGQKPNDFKDLSHAEQVDVVSAEIRSVAGHTLDNLRRGNHDLGWRSVLDGVFKVLAEGVDGAPKVDHDTDVLDLERQVVRIADVRVAEAWAQLSEDDRVALMTEIEGASDFERDAIHGTPHPSWQRLAKPGVAVGALGVLLNGIGLFAVPVVVVGVPALAIRQAKKLLQPSFKKLVPAVLHLLHFNKVDPKAAP